MNLVKELHATARKNYESQLKEADAVLDSVKANLIMEDGKDSDMLKYFGTAEVAKSQTKKIKEANKFIKNEWVTLPDIKKVCLKYHLRFLPATLYKKEIPLTALNDLRVYKEKHNLTDCQLEKGLCIIAPPSHFVLGERPVEDPILLYGNGTEYAILSKWGNDFTFLRLFYRPLSWRIWFNIAYMAFTARVLAYTIPRANNFNDKYSLTFMLISVIFGVLSLLFIIGNFLSPRDGGTHFSLIKKNFWNEPYKN